MNMVTIRRGKANWLPEEHQLQIMRWAATLIAQKKLTYWRAMNTLATEFNIDAQIIRARLRRIVNEPNRQAKAKR